MLSRIWYYAPPGLAVILDVDPVIEISVLLHPVSVQLLQPTPPRPSQNMCPRGKAAAGRGLCAQRKRTAGPRQVAQVPVQKSEPATPGRSGKRRSVRTRGDLAQRKSGAMSWAMASRPWRGRQSAGGRHGGLVDSPSAGCTSTPMLRCSITTRPRSAGLSAAGEMVGGIFHFNYPSGAGLVSGAVFGRLAGASAARNR